MGRGIFLGGLGPGPGHLPPEQDLHGPGPGIQGHRRLGSRTSLSQPLGPGALSLPLDFRLGRRQTLPQPQEGSLEARQQGGAHVVGPGGQPELVRKVQVPEDPVQELGAILEEERIVVAAFQEDGQTRRLDPFGISNSTVGRVVLFE